MAIYALKKAVALAEAAQLDELQADGYLHLSRAYQQKGDDKKAMEYQKRFVDTSRRPSSRLCEILAHLAKYVEPVEKVIYLRKCREGAKGLEAEGRVL